MVKQSMGLDKGQNSGTYWQPAKYMPVQEGAALNDAHPLALVDTSRHERTLVSGTSVGHQCPCAASAGQFVPIQRNAFWKTALLRQQTLATPLSVALRQDHDHEVFDPNSSHTSEHR
ncbi:MAG: hypothetical protein K0U36_01305 [Alphaproteobacteria bacterium]|nr:hypothetical protein [Alphaproteobacteria bacterium]